MGSGVINQRVDCIAEYEYKAIESDELTLHVGDVIHDVEQMPGGWWRGDLRGRRGMFPDNFVRELAAGEEEVPILRGGGGAVGRCKAAFGYRPANADELELVAGETLEVLGQVEEGWWRGRSAGGRTGVFPSNFVVLLDPAARARPAALAAPAPGLPPKPVRELCRVFFPYSAENEDELSLAEGDMVTLLSREAPDRGWWRGELRGRLGFFPNNFVQVIPAATSEQVEKKPERPPPKATSNLPISKFNQNLPSHKDTKSSTLHKQEPHTNSTALNHKEKKEDADAPHIDNNISTMTSSHLSTASSQDSSSSISTSSATDQFKKPPVPMKKSTSPISTGTDRLLTGLKQKVLGNENKFSSILMSEADKPDGGAASRLSAPPAANSSLTGVQQIIHPQPTPEGDGFDLVERNSMLNDPRADRVKPPRRRLPTQGPRDDIINDPELSNGVLHEDKSLDSDHEIKPKARDWEKRKAPWMDELKLNQAKKTSPIADIGKSKSVSVAESITQHLNAQHQKKNASSSTDKIVDCNNDDKKEPTIEMSKSMSSIASKTNSKLENFDEMQQVQLRKKESFEYHKKTVAPQPIAVKSELRVSTTSDIVGPPTPSGRSVSILGDHRPSTPISPTSTDQLLIAQLNSRITNLEKLVETQNAKFSVIVEDLTRKLAIESEKRVALQNELEKLAHCVTQV